MVTGISVSKYLFCLQGDIRSKIKYRDDSLTQGENRGTRGRARSPPRAPRAALSLRAASLRALRLVPAPRPAFILPAQNGSGSPQPLTGIRLHFPPLPLPIPIPAAPRPHRDAPPVSLATTTLGGLAGLPGGCLRSRFGPPLPGSLLRGSLRGNAEHGTRDGRRGPAEPLSSIRCCSLRQRLDTRSGPGGAFPGRQRGAALFRRHLVALGVRRSGAAGRERGQGLVRPLWGRRRARGTRGAADGPVWGGNKAGWRRCAADGPSRGLGPSAGAGLRRLRYGEAEGPGALGGSRVGPRLPGRAEMPARGSWLCVVSRPAGTRSAGGYHGWEVSDCPRWLSAGCCKAVETFLRVLEQ